MTIEFKASERILESSERLLEASEKMSDSFKGFAQAILKGVFEPDVSSRNSAVAEAQERVQNDEMRGFGVIRKAIILDVLSDTILACTYLSIKDTYTRYEWLLSHIKLEEAKRKKEFQ